MDKNDIYWYKNITYSVDSSIFDIQRFASADSEGRTEKATEHKKKKAREEGRVALSKDIPASVVPLFCFIIIYILGDYFFNTIQNTFRAVLENISTLDISNNNIYFELIIFPFFKIFLPIGLISMLLGIVSNYGQIGFKIVPKLIVPDFKKIIPNVVKFFANQVFSTNGAFGLFKSITKVLIIGIVSYIIISSKLEKIKTLMFVDDLLSSFTFIASLCFELIVKSIIVLLILSIVDWFFVKRQYEDQLKMSKKEIKQEFKELEGDPFIKARLRQMYQEILQLKKVATANVVVTNPTHYAVAIRYDTTKEYVPRVIAKGEDNFAKKIKEVAKRNNIYIYENKELARALYGSVKIGGLIPDELLTFVATALVLAFKYGDKKSKVAI